MIIRKLRLQKAWSQEQLAQFSGLSIRTIQRIERGQNAGLESLKSLAAVFELPLTELQQDKIMTSENTLTTDEQQAIEYVRDIKGFYSHLLSYILVVGGLLIFNLITTPEVIWAGFAAFGWGIGIIIHAINVFELFSFFDANWEKKQVEKRLGRKL